jgi:hypothetical protein
MAGEGRDTIIFLDKNRIYIYDGNGVLRLDVPENVIRDVDVVDKSGFDSLVDTFIKTKKLDPAHIWMILADGVCFSRDVAQTDPAKLENDVRDFLEAVPFDQVLSKRYRAGGGVRVIATNLEYIEAITEIFEREGFSVEGIVPGAIFPGFNVKKVLDVEFARYILDNKSLMRTGNMLTKAFTPVTNKPETPEAPKKSRLLPYLLIGFAVLLIILVVVMVVRK